MEPMGRYISTVTLQIMSSVWSWGLVLRVVRFGSLALLASWPEYIRRTASRGLSQCTYMKDYKNNEGARYLIVPSP